MLSAKDRGEDDQLVAYREFRENVRRDKNGRYEVGVPRIPGSTLTSTNKGASRKRLDNVERTLKSDPKLERKYC